MNLTFQNSRNIKTAILTLIVLFTSMMAGLAFLPHQAGAQTPAPNADFKGELCGGANLTLSSGTCQEGGNPETKANNLITTIINIFTTIVGIVAVIMIIVSGFKYITSGGDSGKISSAKSTIIYAIVGLIIVALAQFIVRFVLKKTTA
jgi:heme/copper-type cytochrome/quinol oxidase subunit 3